MNMGFYQEKNVLVTGAAGIIGQTAVRRLLDEGANVRAAVFSGRKLEIQHPKLEIARYDLMNQEECMNALKDMDICFNFAAFIRGAEGQSKSENLLNFVRNNLFISINMFNASVSSRINRFGFVSSSTVYPDVDYPVKEEEGFDLEPPVCYSGVGWMKRYCEKVMKYYQTISKTSFGIIRTTAVYGPHDSFNENGHVIPQLILRADKKEDPFQVWGDGTQIRDFIYVEDVVDGLMKVVEKNPIAMPYNVATGKATTIKELAEMITSIYGFSPAFQYDSSRPTMIPARLVDVSKIKQELNWESKYSLRKGLEKTIEWYRQTKPI
jgi:GDP-L-fucose synthase